MADDGFEIKMGPNIQDFKITLDGVDVTEQMGVRRVKFDAGPESGPFVVNLEIYVDKLELIPTTVNVTHTQD